MPSKRFTSIVGLSSRTLLSLNLYRGQRSAKWDLKTSAQRSCDRRHIEPGRRREHEEALFREFRRTYHQYATHVPDPRAVVEWLSLMQHHGAPTRLLDFNYSIYIASYFALENAEEDCAIWAVRGPWALRESAQLLRAAGKANVDRMERRFVEGDEEVVQALFFAEPYAAAWPINAFRLNERLRIQQGAFSHPRRHFEAVQHSQLASLQMRLQIAPVACSPC
jgi:hypothetical protein